MATGEIVAFMVRPAMRKHRPETRVDALLTMRGENEDEQQRERKT
jgi:hypothetical protein